MDINSRKGRNPELLMDWNGHPVQCFPLGGDTEEVIVNATFVAKSSLIRVVNKSLTDIAFLKRSGLGETDPGTPIVPNFPEMFSVIPGEIYTALTANIYVTHIRERDV